MLTADISDAAAVDAALRGREFDVVADMIACTADHVQRDIDRFEGRTGQYVFISSASAYQKPVAHLPITESTPLRNPHWQYSRDKIACEELLTRAYRDRDFPVTVLRPSHTYDKWTIPAFGGWTAIDRLRRGEEIGRVGPEPGHCEPATCLHLGAKRDDTYLDPMGFFGARRVVLLPVA